MRWVGAVLVAVGISVSALSGPASAQSPPPLYRVILGDGTALASYGEWARIGDRIVFSMPLTLDLDAPELHLVSLPVGRVDWLRTEQYADAVRSAQYAAVRGETDFARFSADLARALNEIALIDDPAARLATAEHARRTLAEWPARHYGYRAGEVRELLSVLDEIIASLRGTSGGSAFELALSATTTSGPPLAPLLPAPDQQELLAQLVTASTLVDTPAEKMSLLQSVLTLLERAAAVLPERVSQGLRRTVQRSIAQERKIDDAYGRLRVTTLSTAGRYARQADVRRLERLRTQVREQDAKLGSQRPDDVTALVAALDERLDAARRLRLAHDQWLLRAAGVRAYARATASFVQSMESSSASLQDIRALAGPGPERLRVLLARLTHEGRLLAALESPDALAGVHAVFRSACELAQNAAQLRLDAAAAGDYALAEQASSAASGALMLFAHAKADLLSALRPPIEP